MRRIIKWILISCFLLVALLAAALAIVPGMYENTIRVDVKKKINENLDAEVSFDHISLRIYRHFPNLTLSLHDLLVMGKGGI